jgi:hypothetical protein
MSQLAYGRNYNLIFIPTQTSLPTITIGSLGPGSRTGRDRGLNITFDIKKSFPTSLLSATANTCTIKIYNLTDSTAKALQVAGLFTLELGYGGRLYEVFAGSLAKATFGREGLDNYLQISMVSGKIVKKSRYFAKAYAKGATRFQIIRDLVAKIGEDYFPDSNGIAAFAVDPKTDKKYKTAQAKSGDAIQLLAGMLPRHNVVLNNRTVDVYPKEVVGKELITSAPIFDLGPKTGLIEHNFTSTPSLDGEDNNYAGVSLRTILYAQIDINFVFRLIGDKGELLYYRVKSLQHIGQIYGGDFNTIFEGELIETMTGGI